MRALHIGKFWPPYAGGIERFSQALCAGLADRGMDVDVLAHASPGQAKSCTNAQRLHVELAACLGQVAYTPLSPGFAPALLRQLRQRKPQLVHLHMPNPAAFWPLLMPAARKLPWVVHWHSDIPLQDAPTSVRLAYPLYRPWERALLRRAETIIATSPGYRDASAPLQPFRDKVKVVPLGLNPSPPPSEHAVEQARALWPADGLRLLAVGRLSHYKGFDVLLRALAQTRDINLVLIGSGECASSLQQLRSELGLEHRVRLAGALNDQQRDAAYAAAELFCLPSVARSEAFGLVLLEAMRAGLPVIASDVKGSGIHHVVDAGRAGRLVAAGNVALLANALSGLAADPARREAVARAGHARWQTEFTLDSVVEATFALYQQLLG